MRCTAPPFGPESGARLEAFRIPDVCNLPHLLSALEDALAYARALVTIELNASDSKPIVLPVESAPVAVGNYKSQPVPE
jgi:histidine ammonia-lyase